MNQFKNKNSFDRRKQESSDILNKYPERIPVIVQKSNDCQLPDVDKSKFLVPKDLSVSQFLFVIRKRIQLEPSQSLFITMNGNLVSGSSLLLQAYDDYKDDDGFLYVMYTSENTFG